MMEIGILSFFLLNLCSAFEKATKNTTPFLSRHENPKYHSDIKTVQSLSEKSKDFAQYGDVLYFSFIQMIFVKKDHPRKLTSSSRNRNPLKNLEILKQKINETKSIMSVKSKTNTQGTILNICERPDFLKNK